MTCISRPSPESLSSSCTSSRRQVSPLMAYSLPPLRNRVRLMVTSAYSIGRAPSELSMVRMTSARPRGPLVAVPAKMTSSILPPRSVLAPCSPITQARASTTLDLPEPLGPTTQVTPSSKANVVDCANDLKPLRVRLFRYTCRPSRRAQNSLDYGTRRACCRRAATLRLLLTVNLGAEVRVVAPRARIMGQQLSCRAAVASG